MQNLEVSKKVHIFATRNTEKRVSHRARAPVGPASALQDVDTQTLRFRRIAPVGPASKALKAEFLVLVRQCLHC